VSDMRMHFRVDRYYPRYDEHRTGAACLGTGKLRQLTKEKQLVTCMNCKRTKIFLDEEEGK